MSILDINEDKCPKMKSKAKNTMLIVMVFMIASASLFVLFSWYTIDTNINLEIDTTKSFLPPNNTSVYVIKSPAGGNLYATTDNATFDLYSIDLVFMTESSKFNFESEGQLTFAMTDNSKQSSDWLEGVDNMVTNGKAGFMVSEFIVQNNTVNKFSMHISSDYYLMVVAVVVVNFKSPPQLASFFISTLFVYVEDHADLDLTGKAIGNPLIELPKGNDLNLNITGIYYDMNYMADYVAFDNLSNTDLATAKAPPYPFILNMTKTTKLNWL